MSSVHVFDPGPRIRERPILFSAPMIRAILAKRKSQTRRLVKGSDGKVPNCGELKPLNIGCPYGVSGDRLWVRETWAPAFYFGDGTKGAVYAADNSYRAADATDMRGPYVNAALIREGVPIRTISDSARWRPSIHMPRAFSRIMLEITSVRVERLRDIDGPGSLYEGVQADKCTCEVCGTTSRMCPATETDYVQTFRSLWDKINGGPGRRWEDNPWVWVVSFKRVPS